MPRPVTMADVALRSGVHKGTVSRALNPATRDQVNSSTLERIERAAASLGYVPNVMASGLRRSLSMTVGVIIPDLTNPIFPPIIRGIESELSPRGYTALLANTDATDSLERAAYRSLLERRVDGFIVGTGLTDHPLLAEAAAAGVRMVLVNRGTSERTPFPLVTGDDASGIRAAVDHLVALGHTDLLHLAGPKDFTSALVRAAAFKEATRRRGLRGTTVTASAFSIEAGRAAMDQALQTGTRRWTAVVASNDLEALGAIRSLRAHGLRCPDDVSVVGFNDMAFLEDFSPPLTSVHVPLLEMGAEAARLLILGVETGSQTPVTVALPVSLIVRGSTAPPRDPRTLPALAYS
ncbi:MAG TPA: LacI family DNA-binding transcriptional regulator [Pseudolysinimonas sp.]